MIREVSLGIRSKNDFQEAAKANGATLALVDCRPLDREGMVILLDIQGKPGAIDATIAAVRDMEGVRQAYERRSITGTTRLLVILDKPGVCRASTGAAIICLDCPFNSTEVPAKWRFVAQRAANLPRIMERLSEEGIEADVKAVSPFGRTMPPTERDERVISVAIQNGFFDFPRRVSIRGLSKIVGVPPAELSRILQD